MSAESRRYILRGDYVPELDMPKRITRRWPYRNDDIVLLDAMQLHDLLHDCALEFWQQGKMQTTDPGRRMASYDQQICLDAAAMIQKLSLEVTRLRLGIGCHLDTGDPDRFLLKKMVKSWNGDKTGD